MSVGPNIGETHFDSWVKVAFAAFTTKLLFSSLSLVSDLQGDEVPPCTYLLPMVFLLASFSLR